jgi:LPXTG-motif cell wall-anchored protein
MFKKLLCAASAIFVLSGSAQALVIDLTNDHCTNACGPAGTIFGTVTLTDTEAGVDFIISPLNGNRLNTAGNAFAMFMFSVVEPLSPTSFAGLPAGFEPVINLGHQNGFGSFTYGIKDVPATNVPFAGPLSFTVSGIDFGDFVKSDGNSSVFFAADILGLNGHTGLVGSSVLSLNQTDVTQTPIPGAFLLMGTVLAGGGGFAAWRRRRERKT